MGQWKLGVTSFQKIYGLYSVAHHGYGGSLWVIGEWVVGYWIVCVTSFQKIYGLYSVEHHKVENWSSKVGCGWVLWVWLACVGDG